MSAEAQRHGGVFEETGRIPEFTHKFFQEDIEPYLRVKLDIQPVFTASDCDKPVHAPTPVL